LWGWAGAAADTAAIAKELPVQTVLVVDDNESIRRGLSRALRHSGYHPVLAEDGCEALEVSAAARPDLVVLDVSMPDMDGFTVLEHLRERPGGAALPVLMYTAVTDADARLRAERLGAGFVAKGTTTWPELMDRVRSRLPPDPS
jgi:CheY-like chemotaxis protein